MDPFSCYSSAEEPSTYSMSEYVMPSTLRIEPPVFLTDMNAVKQLDEIDTPFEAGP